VAQPIFGSSCCGGWTVLGGSTIKRPSRRHRNARREI
jgi:hypothetical protein